jgi:hypothetical protein
MSHVRVFESGASKRQRQREQREKDEESISKNQKLDHFFVRQPSQQSQSHPPESQEPPASSASTSFAEPHSPHSPVGKPTVCGDSGAHSDDSDDTDPFESASKVNPSTDLGADVDDPAYNADVGIWADHIQDKVIEYWITKNSSDCQFKDHDFSASETTYAGEKSSRGCRKDYFYRKQDKTGQLIERNWLCYSPSQAKLFCFHCRLMTNAEQFGKTGCADWRHITMLLNRHESSSSHKDAVIAYRLRVCTQGRVDVELVKEINVREKYWYSVLERISEVIRFLAERGLAFRGHNETIGSPNNGNYLGIIELLSKFDPFLEQHIHAHASQGRGHTSYLSSTIMEELIELMGNEVFARILEELKCAKFYSISVDSTPDISHTDQLTCVVRYVLPSGPVERFLTFLQPERHTGEELAKRVITFLREHSISIQDCRGQSYDNASNMSGRYNGMQAFIKRQSPAAEYVPCAGHSLNLVGQNSVSCCRIAVSFFDIMQKLYTFFTASTYRWAVLEKYVGKKLPVVKRSEGTRWSAKDDAVTAIAVSYNEVCAALDEISEDQWYKADGRNEAKGLVTALEKLETGLMIVLWHRVLNRFSVNSARLQAADQDISTTADIYASLVGFVETLREDFDGVEAQAKELTGIDNYTADAKRVHRRNRRYDDEVTSEEPDVRSSRDAFRQETFLVIIDTLIFELNRRMASYSNLAERFSVFRTCTDDEGKDIRAAAERLVAAYESDLESNIYDEFNQFHRLLKTKLGNNIHKPDQHQSGDCIELRMYKLIMSDNLESVFPNIAIALRIYLCLMVTNCSGERSFSKLKRVKNELRSTMRQDRLNHLTLMSLEHEVLRQTDLTKLIDKFAKVKARKMPICGRGGGVHRV